MAVHEGEERLLTVFADVHYFFHTPSPKPSEHRFDKGSYLYLYGNRSGSGGRLEVANNAGTPQQDAFTGSLDTATVRQSHKHPTLCTVTVDGYHVQNHSVLYPNHYWKLPLADARTERSPPIRLHTVDIYFWTAQDADSFVSYAKRLLQHDQVVLLDVPPPPAPHEKAMSPVVQQLENVAIQDPAYHNGNTRNSSNEHTTPGSNETLKATEPVSFQPLAYNPAAPAAPEPIQHREKTPPPIDADAGTGLAAAAYTDNAQAASLSSLSRPSYGSTTSSQGYVGTGPVLPHHSPYTSPAPGAYTSPVPSATGPRTSSVSTFPPPPPQSPPTSTSASKQQVVPAFSPPPSEPSAPQYDQDGMPLPSPGSQILGGSYVGGGHQPLQHVQPQYADYLGTTGHSSPGPVGGYSNFSYTPQPTQQQQQPSQGNEYNVHSQVYRPTEEEAKHDKRHTPSTAGPGQQPGKLEQQASRVDKGVNRLFKKLEKRIG